jgi:hypothetical protein
LVWVHSPGVYILDNILEEELSEGVGSSLAPPSLVFLFSLAMQTVYQVLHERFGRPRTRGFALLELKLLLQLLHFALELPLLDPIRLPFPLAFLLLPLPFLLLPLAFLLLPLAFLLLGLFSFALLLLSLLSFTLPLAVALSPALLIGLPVPLSALMLILPHSDGRPSYTRSPISERGTISLRCWRLMGRRVDCARLLSRHALVVAML